MTPGMLLAWVGAVCLALVIVVLAVVLIVSMLRSLRTPKSERSTPELGGDRR